MPNMLNTISNQVYNMEERVRLYALYETAHNAACALSEKAAEIDDDAEFEAAQKNVTLAFDASHTAWVRCFAAQFHNCKNEWFRGVVCGFSGEYSRISTRQYNAFRRYVTDTDDFFWKSNTYYCRCAGRLVSIKCAGNAYYMRAQVL